MIFHQNLSERAEERNNCWFWSWSTALQQIDFQIFFVEISSFSCVKQITVKCETKRKLVLALSGETAALEKNWTWTWNIGWRGKQIFRSLFKSLKLVFWPWFTWTERKETAGYYVSTASTFQHKLVSKISQIIFNRNLETCHNIAALEYFQGLWIW